MPEKIKATFKEYVSLTHPTIGPIIENINFATEFFTDKIVALIL
jgi:hypothetical protein